MFRAGQYIVGLINELATAEAHGWIPEPCTPVSWHAPRRRRLASVVFAIAVTIYFWRENTKGIHESSDKALRIMEITTVMVVILIAWCLVTIVKQRTIRPSPYPRPDNLKFRSEALGCLKQHHPGPGSGQEVRRRRHPDRASATRCWP